MKKTAPVKLILLPVMTALLLCGCTTASGKTSGSAAGTSADTIWKTADAGTSGASVEAASSPASDTAGSLSASASQAASSAESLVTSDPSVSQTTADAGPDTSAALSVLAGKKLTVCGDSISTYEGYIPSAYNDFYPATTDIDDVSKTWWMQVIQKTGMTLCSNASSSGSTVSGDLNDPAGFCYGSTVRLDDLQGSDGSSPDIILILGGTNDAINGVSLDTFVSSYQTMLDRMQSRYPDAKIICMTCLPITMWDDGNEMHYRPYVNPLGMTIEFYNYEIRTICKTRDPSVPFIDSYLCGIRPDNALQNSADGTHPNAAGAALLADYVVQQLESFAADGTITQ